MTATQQPHSEPEASYPGVKKVDDPRRANAPYQVTIYHGGGKTRSFHPTFEKAVAAKKASERLQKREGSKAFSYSRELHAEAAEAKRIAPEVPLTVLARDHVARKGSGYQRKTVSEVVAHVLAAKTAVGRSKRHLEDLKSRLTMFSDSFGEQWIETVKRNDILDWLTELNVAGRTVWNFFGAIELLFNHAERNDFVESNPIRRISKADELPAKQKGKVGLLTVEQAEALLRYIEAHCPEYIPYFVLQYFLGIRDAEAERFRGSWIDRKQRRIVIPGWYLDGVDDEPEGIAKTRDDWVILDIPTAFWDWYDTYKEHFHQPADLILFPSNRPWYQIRDALIAQGIFSSWPPNAFRHGFATNHLSAYQNPGKTSIILRHRDAKRLWASYLAKLVPKAIALRYLSIKPKPIAA